MGKICLLSKSGDEFLSPVPMKSWKERFNSTKLPFGLHRSTEVYTYTHTHTMNKIKR